MLQVWGCGSAPTSAAVSALMTHWATHSLAVPLTHHPAAAGARFRLLLLVLQISRHTEVPALPFACSVQADLTYLLPLCSQGHFVLLAEPAGGPAGHSLILAFFVCPAPAWNGFRKASSPARRATIIVFAERGIDKVLLVVLNLLSVADNCFVSR